MRTGLLLVLLLFCIAVPMQAQIIRISTDVEIGAHFANSAGDSISGATISFNPAALPISNLLPLLETFPDSIRIGYFSTDSCSGIIYFKGSYSLSSNTYSRDSLTAISTTTAAAAGGVTVTRSLYNDKGLMGLSYIAKASGNGVLTTHKVWIRIERFFTKTK